MRLDKFLAGTFVGTRKEVIQLIVKGQIKINGVVSKDGSTQIDADTDVITYNGKFVEKAPLRYYMLHKSSGCITARKDHKDKTVLDYFPEELQSGLFPVGRLDKDTEGLLFLTNDGAFDHQLMHPDKHMEKTYYFWVFGSLDEDKINRLKSGVSIGEDEPLAYAIALDLEKSGSYEEYKDLIEELSQKNVKKKNDLVAVSAGYITIDEGRKHQVKRMLKSVGCYVVYLKRISIGKVHLDSSLEKNQFRELRKDELESLV